MDSNIYEFNAASTLALYADFMDGCSNDMVIVLSGSPLPAEARTALSNSMERLGYGEGTCCWVSLHASEGAADGTTLGAMDVRTIIEGMDPAACIATDAQASSSLAEAYERTARPDAHERILGRDVLYFADFKGMLTEEVQKQRAWALLKRTAR